MWGILFTHFGIFLLPYFMSSSEFLWPSLQTLDTTGRETPLSSSFNGAHIFAELKAYAQSLACSTSSTVSPSSSLLPGRRNSSKQLAVGSFFVWRHCRKGQHNKMHFPSWYTQCQPRVATTLWFVAVLSQQSLQYQFPGQIHPIRLRSSGRRRCNTMQQAKQTKHAGESGIEDAQCTCRAF